MELIKTIDGKVKDLNNYYYEIINDAGQFYPITDETKFFILLFSFKTTRRCGRFEITRDQAEEIQRNPIDGHFISSTGCTTCYPPSMYEKNPKFNR